MIEWGALARNEELVSFNKSSIRDRARTEMEKCPWGYEIQQRSAGPACVIRRVEYGALEGCAKRRRYETRGKRETEKKRIMGPREFL